MYAHTQYVINLVFMEAGSVKTITIHICSFIEEKDLKRTIFIFITVVFIIIRS